jgi:hypothetical protein
LVIDEFQKVNQLGGQGAEAQMRAAVQRNTDIGFIFAGSKTALLKDMRLIPARPFYRLGIRHFLTPLPRDEFGQFVFALQRRIGKRSARTVLARPGVRLDEPHCDCIGSSAVLPSRRTALLDPMLAFRPGLNQRLCTFNRRLR